MIELRAAHAVALAVWLRTRTDRRIGSHSDLVRTIADLESAGIKIVDIRIYDLDTPRPYSPDVSLFLERMQASNWVKRLTVPLQLTDKGITELKMFVENLFAKRPNLAGLCTILAT